ncbi:MAG: lytic transglycosylase domain-containing protein [Acidimicrobiia bacterium]|nr:lytic transglycosylase domain-containing protein [Acidimicrobiia bacterium]
MLVVALASAACTAGESGLVSGAPVRPTQPPATAVAPPAAEAATPTSLAAELASIEVSIRSPAAAEGNIGDLGRRQQGLYRVLADHPEWQPEVARLAPTEVRAAVEANAAAAMELRGLAEPKAELPRWTIVAPPPVPTLVAHYRAAGAAIGVPWEYLAAIHLVETRMGRIRGDSSAGAQGPMQFLPTTWAIYGEGGDINSDRDAIFAAARLLKSRGAPADMARALFAYNNSTRYVRAITAYAEVIGADERTYAAYHAWQVYYGDRLLPEGFTNP